MAGYTSLQSETMMSIIPLGWYRWPKITLSGSWPTRHFWAGQTKWRLKNSAMWKSERCERWHTAILVKLILFSFSCDKHPINYLQKGCLNLLKHLVFIHALLLSSLSMQAKLWAATFHGFRVMEETHWHTGIYYYKLV